MPRGNHELLCNTIDRKKKKKKKKKEKKRKKKRKRPKVERKLKKHSAGRCKWSCHSGLVHP